ncbi:MAG: class I SAM-dependent methyltransferase [Pirellulaceae bacterium]
MHRLFRSALFLIPVLGKKLRRWEASAKLVEQLSIGQYYSPIASEESIDQHARLEVGIARSIHQRDADLDAIDLNLAGQQSLLDEFVACNALTDGWTKRYPRNNDFFQQMDAAVLHAMISRFRPRRIIEIGSGFSTLAILDSIDTNGLTSTELVLIEPNPERLLSNTSQSDQQRFTLLQRTLSIGDLDRIVKLQENDILLVDSSHVYKIGSDVQLLFESLIPNLPAGVLLHIHDIFFPFDYPASWLRRGHHFNESYILRAFLQYNRDFEILLWNDLVQHLADWPLPEQLRFGDNDISTSFWMRRVKGN